MSRLFIYLAATFAISWGCWWTLAAEIPPGGSVFASGLFRSLYLLGGLGAAIGAAIAVAATPRDAGGIPEYLGQLGRWRVSPLWWLAVLTIPAAFAAGKEWIAIWAGAGAMHAAHLAPLTRAVTLFPMMIVGGGLEELGWRGVAQPAIETRLPRLAAALIVGSIWALWHLPLFLIPGAPQAGLHFPLFAADVVANACLLAWVYAGSRSLLLCVLSHAASNTMTALGVLAIGPPAQAAWIAVAVKLVAAILLLATLRGRPAAQPASA